LSRSGQQRRRPSCFVRLAFPAHSTASPLYPARGPAGGRSSARGEPHGYELLRLEARTIRPEIGTERAGKLNPERFQALVLLLGAGLPLKSPMAFAVKGRRRSRKHRFTMEEATRLWIGVGTLGRRGAMVRCMLLTECRRGEAASMEWAHLRLHDAVLVPVMGAPRRLTKSKEPHRVPLSAPGWRCCAGCRHT
jgi:integrase